MILLTCTGRQLLRVATTKRSPSSMNRMRTLAVTAMLVAIAAPACKRSPCSPDSRFVLTKDRLDKGLELGTSFLLANQRPTGDFNYEYDWRKRKFSEGGHSLRQMSALWGLAFIYRAQQSPALAAAIDKSLAFYAGISRVNKNGARYVVYPGQQIGQMGMTALMALALMEYLRADPPGMDAARREELEKQLDGFLRHLIRALKPDGSWFGSYDLRTGRPNGESNSYVDGEALLALVIAARHLDRRQIRELVIQAAEAGYQRNVVQALKESADSNTTKGYYQWSSMAFYELARSGWSGTANYAGRVIELADWMVDTHKTLTRARNTGYAYEGIIPAWDLARIAGDAEHATKFANVIEKGLAKLMSWQVGHPTANACITKYQSEDRLALGGVQNHHAEAPLRIDVTVHQMHATVFALRYYYAR